jgi:hypothetical protein
MTECLLGFRFRIYGRIADHRFCFRILLCRLHGFIGRIDETFRLRGCLRAFLD